MLAILDTAIVTLTDVRKSALEGTPVDLAAVDAEQITGVCGAATEVVEEHLHRTVLVHAATVYIPTAQWTKARNTTYAFETWIPDWPLVEVDETVVTTPAKKGGQLVFSDTKHESLTGYFGYRRHDQTLAKVQALTGLSGVTVLPDEVPALVRDTTSAVALHLLSDRLEGKYSGNRKIQQIGAGQVQIEESSPRHLQMLLARLNQYRA